jgi:hypothetical protein
MATAISTGQRLAAADAALAAQRTGAGDRLAEERHLAKIKHPATTAAAAHKAATSTSTVAATLSNCWKKSAEAFTPAAAGASSISTAAADRRCEVRVRYADYNGCYDTLDKLYHSQESKCLVSLHPTSMQQEVGLIYFLSFYSCYYVQIAVFLYQQ